MKEEKTKHDKLCNTAIRWLYDRGCCIFAQEVDTVRTRKADAVGVKSQDRYYGYRKNTAYYIEAKASRSDLICQKQKYVYANIENIYMTKNADGYNDIDFFYFIVADGVKYDDDLYPLCGFMDEGGKVIRRAKRIPANKEKTSLILEISHVLVYKVFGKLYLQPNIPKSQ